MSSTTAQPLSPTTAATTQPQTTSKCSRERERETERDRETEIERECVCVHECVCVGGCAYERERQREKQMEGIDSKRKES